MFPIKCVQYDEGIEIESKLEKFDNCEACYGAVCTKP
jgi:hypothetical protein